METFHGREIIPGHQCSNCKSTKIALPKSGKPDELWCMSCGQTWGPDTLFCKVSGCGAVAVHDGYCSNYIYYGSCGGPRPGQYMGD